MGASHIYISLCGAGACLQRVVRTDSAVQTSRVYRAIVTRAIACLVYVCVKLIFGIPIEKAILKHAIPSSTTRRRIIVVGIPLASRRHAGDGHIRMHHDIRSDGLRQDFHDVRRLRKLPGDIWHTMLKAPSQKALRFES